MIEQVKISRISDTCPTLPRSGNVVAMVGSFAPLHNGHLDAVYSASKALTERGIYVESAVFIPNSDEYLSRKLCDDNTIWTYERRIDKIYASDITHLGVPVFVDDVSGRTVGLEQINNRVPDTIKRHLGFTACQTFFVVGSDQLLSMEAHLENEENRAICVLRPGNLDNVQKYLSLPWVMKALEAERFFITEREDMINDISSSKIRKSVIAD